MRSPGMPNVCSISLWVNCETASTRAALPSARRVRWICRLRRRFELSRAPYMCSSRSCTVNDIGTGQAARNPEQVRDVHYIAMQTPHDGAKLETPLQRVFEARPAARSENSPAAVRTPRLWRAIRSGNSCCRGPGEPAFGPRCGCRCQCRIPSCDGCRWRLSRQEFNHREHRGAQGFRIFAG